MKNLKLPITANSIQKGVPLKLVLDKPAVTQLGSNLKLVYPDFEKNKFVKEVLSDIDDLKLKERGFWIAEGMKKYLPDHYATAIKIMLKSLTPPLTDTSNLSLSGMFYLPHVSFVERFGLDKAYNKKKDPFELSMKAQFELTKRFSAEFSIRSFIIDQPDRTFSVLYKWMNDPDPHVRRLCSEGTRPRLPWAQKIHFLAEDPSLSLPILEKLKDDEDLYVRRSVANHVGDIAKDNLDLSLALCEKWLVDASKEVKWVIRHALRYPAKKEHKAALKLREKAK